MKKHKYPEKISQRTRARIKQFRALQIISSETKHRIVPRVIHYETEMALLDVRKDIGFDYILPPFAVMAMMGALFSPLLIRPWMNVTYSVWGWIGVSFLNLFCMCLAVLIVLAPFYLEGRYAPPKSFLYMWVMTTMAVYAFLLVRLVQSAGNTTTGLSKFLAAASILGVMFFTIFVIAGGLITVFISYIVKRRGKASYPDAIFVDGLIRIIYLLEKETSLWLDLDFKHQLMSILEEIASTVKKQIPRRLRSGDTTTDAWLRRKAERIAAAIRERKKWVCTPQFDTREQLISWLGDQLINVTSGNWDALEENEPGKSSRAERYFNILTILRTFVVAFLPLILFLVIQQTPLALKDPISDYVSVGVFIWTAITFLVSLDPFLGTKIAILKDMTELIPFPGKKRD